MSQFKIVILLMMISVTTVAQKDVLPAPEPYFTAIIVSNLEESVAWYSRVFGFEQIHQTGSEEAGYSIAMMKREGALLELLQLKNAVDPATFITENRKTYVKGYFKVGFAVAEFDKWVSFLEASGVTFIGNVVTDDKLGKKMIIVSDPDGNRIQLIEK